MTTEHVVPTDPVIREEWLEETLTEADAAKFLRVKPAWLKRVRCEPGAGPNFILLSPQRIVYVRRDLLEFRDSRRKGSTADYRRKAGQEAEDPLESSSLAAGEEADE